MTGDVNRSGPPLLGAQIRAARAMLKWTAEELATAASLGANTVRRAEGSEGSTSLTAANDKAIRSALESAGIEFIDQTGGGGPGVRLRQPISQFVPKTPAPEDPS